MRQRGSKVAFVRISWRSRRSGFRESIVRTVSPPSVNLFLPASEWVTSGSGSVCLSRMKKDEELISETLEINANGVKEACVNKAAENHGVGKQ